MMKKKTKMDGSSAHSSAGETAKGGQQSAERAAPNITFDQHTIGLALVELAARYVDLVSQLESQMDVPQGVLTCKDQAVRLGSAAIGKKAFDALIREVAPDANARGESR